MSQYVCIFIWNTLKHSIKYNQSQLVMKQSDPQDSSVVQVFYNVQRIVDRRSTPKGYEYLVKWVSYPNSDNTWEPIQHLQSCLDMIELYDQECQEKQRDQRRKEKDIKQKLNQHQKEKPVLSKKADAKSKGKNTAKVQEEEYPPSPIALSSNVDSRPNDQDQVITNDRKRGRPKGTKSQPKRDPTPSKNTIKQAEKEVPKKIHKNEPTAGKFGYIRGDSSPSSPEQAERWSQEACATKKQKKPRIEETGYARPIEGKHLERLAARYLQQLEDGKDKKIKVKKDPSPKPKPKLPEQIYVNKKPTVEVPVEYLDRWYFQEGYSLGTIHTHYFEGNQIIFGVNVMKNRKIFCMAEVSLMDMAQIDKEATEKYMENYLIILTKNFENRSSKLEQLWQQIPQS